MRTPFTGVGTALVTPFTQERRSRRSGGAAARRAARSTPAFISSCPCGTTGENPTLTDAERLRIVEILVEEANGQGAGARRRRRLRHAAK